MRSLLEASFGHSLGHLVPRLLTGLRPTAHEERRNAIEHSLGQNVAVNTSSNSDIRLMRSISPKIPKSERTVSGRPTWALANHLLRQSYLGPGAPSGPFSFLD
jgi:hypothetical protein